VFGDTDWNEVDDNVWAIPSDWYHLSITEDELIPQKGDEDRPEEERKNFWKIVFTVTEGEYVDETMQIRLWVPDPKDDSRNAKKARTRIKQFMTALEIPVSRMSSIQPGQLSEMGFDIYAYCEQKGNFTNPQTYEGKMRLRNASDGAPSTSGSDEGLALFGG
jgi:hypothetical protein